MDSSHSACGFFANGAHHQHYTVYYEDTDAGGVVYHANYLKFAERARTDALRCMGIIQSQLTSSNGLVFVVTGCDIRFHQPAKLDDHISVQTQLLELRKVRMTMRQIIQREQKDLVTLNVDIAMLNQDGKPTAIPDEIATGLQSHLTNR